MSQPLRHVPETCMSGGQISGADERTGTVSSCRIYEKKVMKHCMLIKKTITRKFPVYTTIYWCHINYTET